MAGGQDAWWWWDALLAAAGLALIWWRAETSDGQVLARPVIATFEARVERVEPLPSRDLVRLRLAPVQVVAVPARPGRGDTRPLPKLLHHVRVNLAEADVPAGLSRGATIRLGARLMPPPQPAVPEPMTMPASPGSTGSALPGVGSGR